MATQSISCSPSNSSDAYFRDWGKKLSDAMTAVGFTKTADTGQIDWATVAKPPAVSTYQGYEIRAFSDALQSTNPIIVKFSFGSASGSANNCALKIQIGRATDGAGNFVGETTTAFELTNSSSSTTAYNGYISGASNRVSFALFVNSSYIFMFYVERTKNASGADTADGIDSVGIRTSGNYQQYFPNKGIGFPAVLASSALCCACPYSGAGTYGSDIGLFPIFVNRGYADNPSLGACVYFTADIAAETDVTLTILGASHTFKTMAGSIGNVNGNGGAKSLALRYE
jgi:hypothetical protein